jgi:hypothetical protein
METRQISVATALVRLVQIGTEAGVIDVLTHASFCVATKPDVRSVG